MDYKVGDIISYTTFSNVSRRVRVTAKYDDVKDGRPGFDGVSLILGGDAMDVWGYDDQITRVESV